MSFWVFLESEIPITADLTYTTFIGAFNQISISQRNNAPSYLTMDLWMASPLELEMNSPTYCTGTATCLGGIFLIIFLNS